MKPLDKVNHVRTVWVAIAAAAVTIWAFPGVQATVVNTIVHPTPQNVGAAVGTIITGLLLYVSKPAGVS